MITIDKIKSWEKKFDEDKISVILQNSVQKNGFNATAINSQVVKEHTFTFSNEIKTGAITNQKKSGRCWMFAGYNVVRNQVNEKLNCKNFEFSQTYTFFYDKLEKSNAYLSYVLEHLDEDYNSRVFDSIMYTGPTDGGWFDNFKELIKKYGCVPKSVMPETFHSSDSDGFVNLMYAVLRKATCEIKKAHCEGKSKSDLEAICEDALYKVYNICVKALGKPADKFTYEYYDKDDKFVRLKEMTPVEFYNEYVSNYFDDKITLYFNPAISDKIGRVIEVKRTGAVVETGDVKYLNVPHDEIRKATIKSIDANEPVWFACDVGLNSDRKLGILDPDLYNYEEVAGVARDFDKKDRYLFRNTDMTHAMVFTGVDLDENGKARYWKVENSWGKDNGKDGFFSMSDTWFERELIEVIVDKKFVSEEYLDGLNKEVIVLEPWEYTL